MLIRLSFDYDMIIEHIMSYSPWLCKLHSSFELACSARRSIATTLWFGIPSTPGTQLASFPGSDTKNADTGAGGGFWGGRKAQCKRAVGGEDQRLIIAVDSDNRSWLVMSNSCKCEEPALERQGPDTAVIELRAASEAATFTHWLKDVNQFWSMFPWFQKSDHDCCNWTALVRIPCHSWSPLSWSYSGRRKRWAVRSSAMWGTRPHGELPGVATIGSILRSNDQLTI